MDDDDSVEFVALTPAGPSSPRRKPHHRRRAPPPPRRRGPFIAAQDVIEIHDSDEDEGVQPSEKGKGKARAVQTWRDNVEPSKGSPRKLPLFLPEIDSDSAEDVQAMLGAGDMLSLPPGRPYIQPSPKDKGKRSLKATVADRLSPRVENRPSLAALPPPSTSNSLASIMPPVATTRIAAQVLEILPDVERGFLHRVIAHQISVYSAEGDVPDLDVNDDERIVQGILHVLFEDASYPKAPAIALLPGNPRPRAAANRMPRNNSPLNEKHKAAPLDTVMNRSTQSELDVYRLLEPDANDQGEGPAARPIASASSAAPAPPPAAPEPEQDPVPRTLAQVLEIIPDVEPTHVTKLIQHNLDIQRVDEGEGQPSSVDAYDRALQGVLHTLFENPDYPKVSKKRKRDAEDDGEGSGSKKAKALGEVDYADATRAKRYSKYYDELSLAQLSNDFPEIPYQILLIEFGLHNTLYAPTFLTLRAKHRRAEPSGPTPSNYVPRKKTKGKGKAAQRSDPEFEKERAWLIRKLQDEVAAGMNSAMEDEGEGFECGCCFSSYPFSKMTQCPDAHLFCVDCVTHYASTLLGEHNPAIACMDQSGCKLLFTPSALRQILSPKLLALYERVSQRKELEAAGLENLEECPFCEYQVVIENEHEKLFRCEREDCGAVSCRKCKKLDHLPKSCEEADVDKKLDARHAVEEAMTAALMRNCPKCNKAFIKESGCNKMVCPHCHTLSCYVCRKIIHGYEHFNQAPPYNTAKDPKKCQLWDGSVEQRHADEVAAAAKRAQEEVKRANPEVGDTDLKVELPPAPPKPAVCNNPHHHHHHHHVALPIPPVPGFGGFGIDNAHVAGRLDDLRLLQQRLQNPAYPPAPPQAFAAAPRRPGAVQPLANPYVPQVMPRVHVQPALPLPPPQHQYQTRARAPAPNHDALAMPAPKRARQVRARR